MKINLRFQITDLRLLRVVSDPEIIKRSEIHFLMRNSLAALAATRSSSLKNTSEKKFQQ
jgi:hypothetical protein